MWPFRWFSIHIEGSSYEWIHSYSWRKGNEGNISAFTLKLIHFYIADNVIHDENEGLEFDIFTFPLPCSFPSYDVNIRVSLDSEEVYRFTQSFAC